MESEFPPRQVCCFCFSARKYDVNKRKRDEVSDSLNAEWGQNNGMLTDCSTFSIQEQERRLKIALKEEEKASKEADRTINWVKQESARMDAKQSAIKGISDQNDPVAIK